MALPKGQWLEPVYAASGRRRGARPGSTKRFASACTEMWIATNYDADRALVIEVGPGEVFKPRQHFLLRDRLVMVAPRYRTEK